MTTIKLSKEERQIKLETERAEIAARRDASMPKTVAISELLFPVEMIDNPNQTNSEYSRIVVGQVDGNEMHLNYCSPRYELIPNSDIFPNIEQVLDANKIDYDVTYTHVSNVRFYADYVINDKKYGHTIKGTNDDIMPMLRVQHSYNGLTRYRIIFGYFRMVCSNGIVIPVQEMKKFNLVIAGKHTESVKRSFAKLDSMLKYFCNDAKKITKEITRKFELLGGRVITKLEDRITEILAATKINAVENNKFNTVNDIINRIKAESDNKNLGYNGHITDWLVYNGINQYINDNSRNIVATEKRIETDSKVMEYMLENV